MDHHMRQARDTTRFKLNGIDLKEPYSKALELA